MPRGVPKKTEPKVISPIKLEVNGESWEIQPTSDEDAEKLQAGIDNYLNALGANRV